MADSVRIDKWLWAVRLFKTRTDAADACRNNRVTVNGAFTKASRDVREGDVVAVRKGAVMFSFRVLEPINNRQPAKNVPQYAENITPQEELDKLNVPRETVFISRDRGTGRPTKKERREIDSLMGDFGPYDDFDDEM
ncbi:RNA-binding S4 domain-containing protein [Alistipes sp. OttesenSCG-928-B03]|nr:RNA-binding S4 domain-containing protein [Alistipes sp. OttesenSCG-928-B03]